MTEINDEQRAQVYRELADLMDRTGNFYEQADLRQKADELDSPEVRWLRSLPTCGPSGLFDQAYYYLGCALKFESDGSTDQMLEQSQHAAAAVVAWRRMLDESQPVLNPPWSKAPDRNLLRIVVKKLLNADGADHHTPRVIALRQGEAALRILWERSNA